MSCSSVLSGSRWFEEHVYQRVPEPLLVARRSPSPSRDQLVVEVGASHRPHAAESIRGGNALAQSRGLKHRGHLGANLVESETFDLLVFRQQGGVAGLAHEAHDRREAFVEATGHLYADTNVDCQVARLASLRHQLIDALGLEAGPDDRLGN